MDSQTPDQAKHRPIWLGWVVWAIAAGLLYLTLKDMPLQTIWDIIRAVGWIKLFVIFGVNFAIILLAALRWQLILRSLVRIVPDLRIFILYRLAGFGVSFFTPGPQFGGEPVQVDLLYNRKNVPLNAAVSSVYLDRLLDLLANFTFLILGIIVTVEGNRAGFGAGWLVIPAVTILAFPLAHLLALWKGKQPITELLRKISGWYRIGLLQKAEKVAEQAEIEITNLCRTQPLHLLQWVGLSGVIWLLMIFEYWLTLSFLGTYPTLVQSIQAMTAGRIALLVPLPGGLGALEASQVFSAVRLGWGSQIGFALSLLIRLRDFIFALTGMIVVFRAYSSIRKSPVLPLEKTGSDDR